MSAPTLPAATVGSATVAEIREMLGGLADGGDMALLKRVFAWGRTNGWYNAPYQAFRVSADRLIAVDVSNDPRPAVGVARRHGPGRAFRSFDWYPVESAREAVDTLVMLGVLPVEFSSLYAAGRADRAAGGER